MRDRLDTATPATARGRAWVSLMARFARRRHDLRIRRYTIADHLGVARPTVTCWDYGRQSPTLAHAAGYAHLLDWRLVLHDGYRVLAHGADIPHCLPALRRVAGLRQVDLAAAMHSSRSAVALFETRGIAILAPIDAYATGLGLHVGVEDLAGAVVLDDMFKGAA